MASPIISMREVAKHNSANDCWVVIGDLVCDLSNFHAGHPGGSSIIVNNAGKDVSAIYDPYHPSDLAKRMLKPNEIKGTIDRSTVRESDVVQIGKSAASSSSGNKDWEKPPLNTMLTSFDFEAVARRTMNAQGWGYYSSGAADEITLRENHMAYQRIWMKPRVMVNVSQIDTSTKLLGSVPSKIPLYITATALGKLADPQGELALIRACHQAGIVQMMPTLSSYSLDDMLEARAPDQVVFSQLYVNPDRQRSLDYIRRLEAAGVAALFITVDAPQLGRREKDMRNKFSLQGAEVQRDDEEEGKVSRDQGVAAALSSFIDTSLSWEDLAWFQHRTSMPIFLKGVQCAEDAVLSLKHGCRGIVISNHGGRQMDTARSAIEVLPEVMAALRRTPGYSRERFDVFVDGGVRRGSDIYKAVALGATAVGIGRPSLYALASYGQDGVEKVLEIFRDELVVAMRLMGKTRVEDISEDGVITTNLANHAMEHPRHHLAVNSYEPLKTQANL